MAQAFSGARSEGRAALIPYLPLGFPTPGESLELVGALAEGGADIIELGIPFSDPLADGSTIQRATHAALQQGMTLSRCLEMAAQVRDRGVKVPLLFMGYLNPILAYGPERFIRACREVGVDGLIVADLPPEEADELEGACHAEERALVYLLAPTSTPARVTLIAGRSTGFVYLVSVTGVTGAREGLPAGLSDRVRLVREVTDKPVAVGFGIAGGAQARAVGQLADGIVVGSAIVERAGWDEGARQAVRDFVRSLRDALEEE
ncbi:MAG: tryptophan synthase subunit alpha [Chloroflexota bacterium]|nr:tryptophan synthase subunit alpha [Chloroflexota bacterium]